MRCFQFKCVGCFVAAALLGSTGVARAELLKVDFNSLGYTGEEYDQLGFSVFEVPRDWKGVDASQTFGTYTVRLQIPEGTQWAGGYFKDMIPDSGEFTYGRLYRDVVYTNYGESLTCTVSGLTPSTSSDLKLYAFDSYEALGDVVNTFTPAPGTVGDAVAVNYNSTAPPSSNDEYAATAHWQSDGAGVISFTVTGQTQDFTYELSARLCGFTIAVDDGSGLAGDLNSDGFVGGDDLDIVRSFWGQNVTLGDLLSGDPSEDGFVGGDDLDIVRANWGQGTPPAPTSVPEPGTAVLLLGAVAAWFFMFRRSR